MGEDWGTNSFEPCAMGSHYEINLAKSQLTDAYPMLRCGCECGTPENLAFLAAGRNSAQECPEPSTIEMQLRLRRKNLVANGTRCEAMIELCLASVRRDYDR